MDFTDSHASKTTKDHILPQTQNTMEVATTYLLSGRLGSNHGKQRTTTSGRKLLCMTRSKPSIHQRDTRRLGYTFFLMSNNVENSRIDLWQMNISPRNLWKLSTQECFLQIPITWNYGEQMGSTTFKH